MSSIYFLNVSQQHTGLCNQLNSILSTICSCINMEKIIVIDKFLEEIFTNNYLPISNIIDLEETNKFLEKYNVALVDGNFTENLNILNATYGFETTVIDVTDKIKLFLDNNILFIKKKMNLNILFGDPMFGEKKCLKIDFILNKFNRFSLSFYEENGFLKNDINIDFTNKKYILAPSWTLIDSPEFMYISKDIYKNLCFHHDILNNSNTFIEKIDISTSSIVNVIHLRLESDALNFWSTSNNLSPENLYIKLSEKYISLISSLINKNDKTIILTYSYENNVIDYLKNNNYNYYIHNKIKNNNREVNALIDFINAKQCNKVFIGVSGSTFSWNVNKVANATHVEWIDIGKL